MSNTFFIPTRKVYWDIPESDSSPATNDNWVAKESRRTKALAERMFSDVAFEFVDTPPGSQTYQPGSLNAQIRALLEERTALRLAGRTRQ